MSFSNQGRFHQQVRFLRRQFLQDGDLPLSSALEQRARFALHQIDDADGCLAMQDA